MDNRLEKSPSDNIPPTFLQRMRSFTLKFKQESAGKSFKRWRLSQGVEKEETAPVEIRRKDKTERKRSFTATPKLSVNNDSVSIIESQQREIQELRQRIEEITAINKQLSAK